MVPVRNIKISYVNFIVILLLLSSGRNVLLAKDDIANIPSEKMIVDKNEKLQFILIGNSQKQNVPKEGFKLLIVLPGGDGSTEFEPFVKRIYKNSLDKNYLICQLVAPKWNRNQKITWPTSKTPVNGMTVSTEQFLVKAIKKIKTTTKINDKKIFTLTWSSGGPAAYAISLMKDTPVKGSFIAMSVFQKKSLPELSSAKGKAYYILHSPKDKVCPVWMARSARNNLLHHKAKVEYLEYEGGHGWRGNVFGTIKTGCVWLDEQTKTKAP